MNRRRGLMISGAVALVVAVSAPAWWFATTGSTTVPPPPAVVITPAKTSILVGEPLVGTVEVSNPGAESTTVNVHPSLGFQGLVLSVAQGAGPFKPVAPPIVQAGGLDDLELAPMTLAPGQSVQRTVTLFFNLLSNAVPFPSAGAYSVRATLYLTPGDVASGVSSNTVGISATTATGTDAAALASLQSQDLDELLTAQAVYMGEARFKTAAMRQFLTDFPSTPYTPFVQAAFDATCGAFPTFCQAVVPTGSIAGFVTNVITGAPVDTAVFLLRPPASPSDPICSHPSVVDTASSDGAGFFQFDTVPVGTYDLTISRAGFATMCQAGVVVTVGVETALNIHLSPALAPGQVRFVLTWGASPLNLDSHLWLPPFIPFHLYPGRPGTLFGCPFSALAPEDHDGFGPEAVTINQAFPGTFVYAVNRASIDGTLATSGGQVQVYTAAGLVATIRVPTAGLGDWWYVLDFNAGTNTFTTRNLIQPISPAPYPDADSGCGGGVT